MTSEPPVPDPERIASGRHAQVGSEHVEVGQANIDVSSAEIVQSSQSRLQSRYLAYALCVLFIFTIASFGASLLFTSSQVHSVREASSRARANSVALQRQILADCGFYRDLAGLPLANAVNGHPSELGVKIISDSRGAWRGHGCPGKLPPPDPSFVQGAKFYHLPAN